MVRMARYVFVSALFFSFLAPGVDSGLTGFFQNPSLAAAAQRPFNERFASPDAGVRPKFRYWWPNAEVDFDQIRLEMNQIADAGFGGVEIADVFDSIPGDVKMNRNRLWGSPAWIEAVETALSAAKARGLRVDLTVGPHWPAVINTITPDSEGASKELVYGREIIEAGQACSGIVPEPMADNPPEEGVHEKELIAVQAARVIDVFTEEEGRGNFFFQSKTVVEKVRIDINSVVDLTAMVRDTVTDGHPVKTIEWQAPKDGSRWIVTGFWQRGTGQRAAMYFMDKNKGALMDPEPYVVDHFSTAGARAMIDYWESTLLTPRILELLGEVGGAIFEDSLELDAYGFWTPTMLEDFYRLRGYRLEPYLHLVLKIVNDNEAKKSASPFLVEGDDENELPGRIRRDYQQTLSDLYVEKRVKALTAWANSHGLEFRVQPYGATVDSALAAATADIPEGESLGFGDNGFDSFRFLAAGRDMGGNRVLSDEAGAFMGTAYATTWKQMLSTINKNFSAGVNQIIAHGFSHAFAPGASWPGFAAFTPMMGGRGFAESWGPRQPTWKHMADVAGYLARTQTVLQTGGARTDVAVFHEDFNASAGAPYIEDRGLMEAGYSYQFVSHGLLDLPSAIVSDGVLAPEGPGYKALVINQADMLPESAAKILDFAKKGLPVVIVGKAPQKSKGYASSDDTAEPLKAVEAMDEKVGSVFAAISKLKTVRTVAGEADIADALSELGILPDAEYAKAAGILNVHRSEKGTDFYYLYNPGNETVEMPVSLKGNGRPYLLNAWTGDIEPVAVFEVKTAGRIETSVRIVPEDTVIIAVGGGNSLGPATNLHAASTDAALKYTADGLALRATEDGILKTVFANGETVSVVVSDVPEPIDLTAGMWQLEVESWGPGKKSKTDITDTKKTTVRKELSGLQPWTRIDGIENASGIGMYTVTVTLESPWAGGFGAYLDLGKTLDTVRVLINGTALPPVNQVNPVMDVGPYLKEGENVIQVEVATTLNNVLNAECAELYTTLDAQDYGLIGPVRLVPYGQVVIAGQD